MSPQADYVVANGTGAAVRSDINGQLSAIVSNNSGATEPATMYAYQWWADTTTGLLKLRNAANSAWVTVGTLASANLGLAALASPTFTGTVTAPTFTASTAVNIPLGSAGSPTLFFTGDTNNGLFSPGADIVALTTNGSERFRIAASGQIGLGGANYGTSGQALTSNGSGSAPTWQTPVSTSDKISEGNTEAEVVDTGSDGHFKVTTEGSERLRVDPSGRLLVGTSTARSNLNNTTDTARAQVEGTDANTSSLALICNNGGGVPVASIHLAKSDGASIGSTGAVANNWDLGDIRFSGSDGTEFVQAASIACEVDGTPGANDMPGRLVFSTTADGASSPTERMRITNDGQSRFGNNPTGAGDRLLIQEIDPTNGFCIFTVVTGTGTKSHVRFGNGNGLVGSITTNGTATTYATSSDYRLKENVVPLTGAIDRLQQIPVHRFNFITDPDKVLDGFIAHEAQAIVPECVVGDKDAVDDEGNPIYQGIDQSKLVPLLTAALQEAIAKIETLEAKVAALEAQ
jgi:hypothetical protein